MSKSQAIAFFEEISRNQQLAQEVEKVIGGKNSDEAKAKELLSLAKTKGFNFTQEEAESAQEKLKTSLSPKDMLEVSGGDGFRSSVMAMALLACLGGSVSTLPNIVTSAMKPSHQQTSPQTQTDFREDPILAWFNSHCTTTYFDESFEGDGELFFSESPSPRAPVDRDAMLVSRFERKKAAKEMRKSSISEFKRIKKDFNEFSQQLNGDSYDIDGNPIPFAQNVLDHLLALRVACMEYLNTYSTQENEYKQQVTRIKNQVDLLWEQVDEYVDIFSQYQSAYAAATFANADDLDEDLEVELEDLQEMLGSYISKYSNCTEGFQTYCLKSISDALSSVNFHLSEIKHQEESQMHQEESQMHQAIEQAKYTDFCKKDKMMLKNLYAKYLSTDWTDNDLYYTIYCFLGAEIRDSKNPYLPINTEYTKQICDAFRSIGHNYKTLLQDGNSCTYIHFIPEEDLSITKDLKEYRITVNTKTELDTLKILHKLVEVFMTKQNVSNYISSFKGLLTTFDSQPLITNSRLIKSDKIVIYFYDNEDSNVKQEILNLIKDAGSEISPSMSAFYQTGLYEDKAANDPYNHGVGFGRQLQGTSFTEIRTESIINALNNATHLDISQQTEYYFINNVKLEFLKNGIDPQTPHLQG